MTPVEDVLARARAFIALVRGDGCEEVVRPGVTKHRPAKIEAIGPQLVLPDIVPPAATLEKTIWGSPAGKKRLAARLVKLIPPHQVYVEPFAGSAAVFFEKEPAAAEVLSDGDPEISFAFRAIKSLTNDELAALRRKDWVGREKTFLALREAKPRGKVAKLYRFLYLSHFAYGKLRGKSYNHNAEGIEARTMDRVDTFRDRLKNVTVRSGHYADVVKEFDGKDTFFFLDPPYPGHNVEVGEDVFDEVEFRKVLDSIKGRFLVTYGTRGQLDTKGFHVRKIRTPRTIRAMHGVEGPKTLPQLLIANYAITEKTVGQLAETLVLDDVEVIDLHEEIAADLERTRTLTKVLAQERGAPPELATLAEELDRLEAAGDRSAVLATDLIELTTRVAPELKDAAPEAADAMVDAGLALEELLKAQWTRAYVNALPDTAFLYVEPGGQKDKAGKTIPRTLRHFPVRDRDGALDLPHLRNALARIPQSEAPGLTEEARSKLKDQARGLLADAQQTEAELAKARVIPFQQWGGSAKYASKLAARLPEHKRYIEPFCGAAAVFFAKERVAEEVLADADADVVFAHKYIQALDARSMAALKRHIWKVSRSGFERARRSEPASDAERFWKHVYGRLCTWGAKPNMSGFASIHDGQTYDLDDLWRFKERLKGARLVTQDWKKTLAAGDGPDTLFFIDPPYAGEWAVGDGIAPEEIAEAVGKLKGAYVIAYTDSAQARRALAKVGRPFTMRIPEGRSAGQWKKRSRLFVASFKVEKVDDLEWLDVPTEPAAPSDLITATLAKPIPLLKSGDERYVYGIVLEPETVDAQKDIYSAAEVRDAAHRFMEEYQNIGLMHRGLVNDGVKILESYVAPTEFEVGGTLVKKGTWLLAVRVQDEKLWQQVKAGELGGFSIGGTAIRGP